MSSIEIDDMPLVTHKRDPDTGATKEIRSVNNINIGEKRRIVEHRIPGMAGNVLQDLGKEPVRISFDGVFYGETAREDLENLRAKFKAGEPVPFLSNISDIAEVTQVLIEELYIDDISGVTNTYRYSIGLREYIAPKEEEEEPPPSQEEEAKEETEEESDEALASVNYITGKVLDAKGNPLKDVNVKITWDGGEYTVKTNEEGVYRKDDLESGKYTVTIDAPGFEDKKEEVEIEK